ncbi:MAG TPA: COX15/CtaA family protein [Anaerolineales bacterium]|nr:COX15/CtaA family protein [Anaerolineales bacterium]
MTTDFSTGNSSITRSHRILLLAAAIMVYLLVTMGGIVCATRSTLGCPDWPGCFGQFIPPPQSNALIEYTHRFIAALTTPLIIVVAVVGWRRTPTIGWVSRPPVIAIALTCAVIVFGAFAVLTGLPPALAAVDLGSALIVLALMVTATVVAFARRNDSALVSPALLRGSFVKLTLWAAGGVFFVLVSGVLVAKSGSLVRCLGWPLYNELPILSDLRGWLLLGRYLIAGGSVILIAGIVIQAWRTQRWQSGIRQAASLVGVLLLLEAAIGIFMLTHGFAPLLLVAYVAVAAALWAMLVVLVVIAGLRASR